MSPIRPEMKARYPKNWKEIRKDILFRAEDRCECMGECGCVPATFATRRCPEVNGKEAQFFRGYVVLTIAHTKDPSPENCAPSNLKAMCQKCHNRLDAPMRAAGRKKRAAEAAGQGELL